jgi:SAM-dependent methyltransferase
MTSTDRHYFEQMYGRDPDPWGFASSEYERRKYALTVASLPRPCYRSAFEPGCSIGVLTELLAARCNRLVATDFMPSAIRLAQQRLAHAPHVEVEQRTIPGEWPAGPFDLIVLSEIAYYFDRHDFDLVLSRTVDSTAAGAHVVGVHWRGITDYPLSGDGAHHLIDACRQLDRIVHHVESEFVLDVWERRA